MKEEDTPELLEAFELQKSAVAEWLHDGVCQSLAGAAMALERIARAASSGAAPPADAVEMLRHTLDSGIDQLRAGSARLNPGDLRGFGLMKALANLAQAVGFALRCEKPVAVSDARTALALYRIVEAVALQQTAFEVFFSSEDGCVQMDLRGFRELTPPVRALMELQAKGMSGTISYRNDTAACRAPAEGQGQAASERTFSSSDTGNGLNK